MSFAGLDTNHARQSFMRKQANKWVVNASIHPERGRFVERKLKQLKEEYPEKRWTASSVIDIALGFWMTYEREAAGRGQGQAPA